MKNILFAFVIFVIIQNILFSVNANDNPKPILLGGFTGGYGDGQSNQNDAESKNRKLNSCLKMIKKSSNLNELNKETNPISGFLEQHSTQEEFLNNENISIMYYSTQVVAGMNYLCLLKINDKYQCLKVYEPLPYTKENPKITSNAFAVEKENIKSVGFRESCGIPSYADLSDL